MKRLASLALFVVGFGLGVWLNQPQPSRHYSRPVSSQAEEDLATAAEEANDLRQQAIDRAEDQADELRFATEEAAERIANAIESANNQ